MMYTNFTNFNLLNALIILSMPFSLKSGYV